MTLGKPCDTPVDTAGKTPHLPTGPPRPPPQPGENLCTNPPLIHSPSTAQTRANTSQTHARPQIHRPYHSYYS